VSPREVVIVDYDPVWPARAAALVEELTNALGERARRIEHIGSTSIPGMAAKDVLDVQVSVDDLDLAARSFDEPLRALGFERKPYEHDHVPAGSSDDPELWVKRYWSRRGSAGGAVNLHVRLVGSPNERLARRALLGQTFAVTIGDWVVPIWFDILVMVAFGALMLMIATWRFGRTE
jgi:GrpB-like predicted nucleotidyltransferase (UPF0157 family)